MIGHAWFHRKYKSVYVHAKKIFFFDICLLFLAAALCFISFRWFIFTPTLGENVSLSISYENKTGEILRTGDTLAITIQTKEEGEKLLASSKNIELFIPKNLTLIKDAFEKNKNGAILLDPKTPHTLLFLIDTEKQETHIIASWDFAGKKTGFWETRTAALTLTPRGSIIDMRVGGNLIENTFTLPIFLKHTKNELLPNFTLRIKGYKSNGTSFFDPNFPVFTTTSWKKNEETSAIIKLNIPPEYDTYRLFFEGYTEINGAEQLIFSSSTTLLREKPSIHFSSSWVESFGKPNTTAHIKIQCDSWLFPEEIISFSITKQHLVKEKANPYTLKKTDCFSSTGAIFAVMIEDVLDQDSAQASAKILPFGFTESVSLPSLPIESNPQLDIQTRYYTFEGDQLGRGPLPPRVGYETQYGLIVSVHGSYNKLQNATVIMTPHTETNIGTRGSASHGSWKKLTNGNILWSIGELSKNESAQFFIDIGIVPKPSTQGLAPMLLDTITLTAKDTETQTTLTQTQKNIRALLEHDVIGKAKGILVTE